MNRPHASRTPGEAISEDSRPSKDHGEITRLLRQSDGDNDRAATARRELAALVHDDLHRIASAHFRNESPCHTLQPTAIVNEGWIRLAEKDRVQWQDREHFLAVASLAMRRILLDHAKARKRLRRGGDRKRENFGATVAMANDDEKDIDLETLAAALDELEHLDPELARVVDLRFIAGLSLEETARVSKLSPATVKRR